MSVKNLIALALATTLLAACGKAENKTAAAAPAAPAASTPAAAPAPAPVAAPAPTAATAPAECDAYVKAVTACVDKMSASNKQVAEMFKKQMDDAKASWTAVADKAALAGTCKQAQDAFSQSSKAMGC
jgi:hypothetical protein